jgi:hypothetical protein
MWAKKPPISVIRFRGQQDLGIVLIIFEEDEITEYDRLHGIQKDPTAYDDDDGDWLKNFIIHRPTPEMMADALRRNSAPRTLTQSICGDPPFEQSALGKKRAAEAKVICP